MAKLSGPLLSFGARGSIGKTLVAAKWRGVPYARQHVIPANPQSAEQTITRTTFAYLREMWKLAPSEVPLAWDAFAEGRPFTGMNKFVGENLRVIRGEPDMNNFIGSPGARGGLAPVSMTAAAGAASGEIDVTLTPPTIPSGWAISKAVWIAFPDADPTGIFTGPFVQATDAAAAYAATLTGLGAAVDCQVSGWFVWTKPDGKLAYSVGLTQQAISHA